MQRKNSTRKIAANPARESKPGLPGALLDASAAAIYVKDKEGRYLLANHEAERVLHTGRDHILGKTDYDLLPKEIADLFHRHDQEVLASGTPLAREEVLPMKDGPHTAVSVKFPIYDASGLCYAVGGISTDITEQKRATELLRQSQERLEQAVQERTVELVRANRVLRAEISARRRAEKALRRKEAILESLTRPLLAGKRGHTLQFSTDLTVRQREVLELVAEGRANKEIAASLNICIKTVEFHKAVIMEKLRLHGTAELTKYAIQHGIASL